MAGCASDKLAPPAQTSPLQLAPSEPRLSLVHDPSLPSYPEAATGTDPNPSAHGLWLGNDVNPANCFRDINPSKWTANPDNDKDDDWLYDDCEFKIASGFRPFLFTGGTNGGCLGGEPYWAAKYFNYHPQGVRYVRVLYMIGYYEDCHLYDGHLGDGERIQLNVHYDAASQHWFFASINMSRHGSFVYYDWTNGNLSYGTETLGKWRGFPRVWVERWKHAHYPNLSICDAPHYCTSDGGARLAVFQDRNVGEVRRFGDAAGVMPNPCPKSVRPNSSSDLVECFIVDRRFRGWNDIDGGNSYFHDMKNDYAPFWDRMSPDTVWGFGPGAPPPVLYIDGPLSIAPYQNHTWTALVNGVAPVSVQWYVDGSPAETSQSISRSWPPNETHTLQVVATAGDNTSNAAVLYPQTYNECPGGGACEEWNIQGPTTAVPQIDGKAPRKSIVFKPRKQ